MADTVWQAQSPKWDLGAGASLRATGAVTTTTNSTAVEVGRGWFAVKIVLDAVEIASNTELYGIVLQANTAAATSTWVDILHYTVGPLEVNGIGTDDVTDTIWLAVYNEGDYQVRCRTVVGGSGVSSGISYTCDLYPLAAKAG